jgi:hypothetical protein
VQGKTDTLLWPSNNFHVTRQHTLTGSGGPYLNIIMWTFMRYSGAREPQPVIVFQLKMWECGIDLVSSGCCNVPCAVQSIWVLRWEVRAFNDPTESSYYGIAICYKQKSESTNSNWEVRITNECNYNGSSLPVEIQGTDFGTDVMQ